MRRADSFEKTLMLAGKDWGQEEKGTTEDEMVEWHHQLNGHGFGWTPGVGDGQGGLACCGSWGHKELDTTEWLNWTELNWTEYLMSVYLLALVEDPKKVEKHFSSPTVEQFLGRGKEYRVRWFGIQISILPLGIYCSWISSSVWVCLFHQLWSSCVECWGQGTRSFLILINSSTWKGLYYCMASLAPSTSPRKEGLVF